MKSLERRIKRLESDKRINTPPPIVITGLTIHYCDKTNRIIQFKSFKNRDEYLDNLAKQYPDITLFNNDIID